MRIWLALPLSLVAIGCAKFPAIGTQAGGKRLTFTLTVDRAIHPGFVYIIALRPSTDPNPPDQGPIPVIAPPWGNGFVAGNCTYFVRWDNLQSPNYILYQFRDPQLSQWFQVGVPVDYVDPAQGQPNQIKFSLNLSQLAATPQLAALYQSIQVNFLTMDRVPQGSGGSKIWDALGDGHLLSHVNDFITVPLRTSGVYDNRHYQNLEPRGDCPDPDLDITDFSVEVNLQ